MGVTAAGAVKDQPIRVFVGSCASTAVEEQTLLRSLLEHTECLLDVWIIDGIERVLREVATGSEKPLPEEWRDRVAGDSGFAFARFAPPELCGYDGRAIYLESDQLVYADIGELWDLDLAGASVGAVRYEHMLGTVPYQREGYLNSVLVFDCARSTGLSMAAVTERHGETPSKFSDWLSMTPAFLEQFGLDVVAIDPAWNVCDKVVDGTKILHFTNWESHPWRVAGHPCAAQWRKAYLDCAAAGHLSGELLAKATQLGYVSRRMQALPRIPRVLAAPIDYAWQHGELLSHAFRRRRQRLASSPTNETIC